MKIIHHTISVRQLRRSAVFVSFILVFYFTLLTPSVHAATMNASTGILLNGSSLTSGLVNHWTFDGKNMVNGAAMDLTGGNTGRLIGIATSTFYTQGKLGQGFDFDGTNDYVAITDASLASGSNITVSAWFNQSSAKYVGLFTSAAVSDGPGEFGLFINESGVPVFTAWITGAGDRPHLNATAASAISFGVWHHAVGIYDVSAGYAYIYIDGVLAGSSNTTVNSSTWNGPAIGSGGVGGTTTYFLNGKEDDVRVYNRALSAAEVKRLYLLGGGQTSASSGILTNGSTLGSGLVGHWTFDGKDISSGTALDKSGRGNNMSFFSISTSTFYTLGKLGQAINIDGTDDYTQATDSSDFNFGTGDFAISWWEYRTSNDNGRVAIVRDTRNGFTGFLLGYSAGAANLQIYMTSAGSSWDIANAKTLGSVTLNTWNHFVVTRSGTSFTAYKNGVVTATWTSSGSILSGASGPQLGRYQSASFYYYKGRMDDVRFYNRAFTAAEVKRLYLLGGGQTNASSVILTNGSTLGSGLVGLWTFDGKDIDANIIYDRSGQANNGGFYNGATSTAKVAGKLGQAFNFDGTDDHIMVPNSTVLSNITASTTLAAWVYLNTYTSGGTNTDIAVVVEKTSQYYMSIDSTTGKLNIYLEGLTGSHTPSTSAVSLSKWAHVAVTYDQSNIRWYINGVLDKTSAQTGSITANGNAVKIGGEPGYGRFLNGKIDDVRVYSRALSAAEVKQLYLMGR